MNGSLFDIIILGFFVSLITTIQEKQKNIKRWKEEIDDYRGWDDKEATYRIVGNIKRLNNNNTFDLDLHHCFLLNAKLSGAKLIGANLTKADLSGADLSRTNLTKAILSGAKLSRAKLSWAGLSAAENITAKQLLEAATLYRTKMDADILKEIKEKKPELLATRWNKEERKWFIDTALLEEIKKPDWKGWDEEPS
jgi:hypothetical protein